MKNHAGALSEVLSSLVLSLRVGPDDFQCVVLKVCHPKVYDMLRVVRAI